MVVRGIDIASHQEPILWDVLDAARSEFVVVKATGGGTYKNPLYRTQVDNARRRGRIVGHYHYAHELTFEAHQPQGKFSPEQEAAHFLANSDIRPGDFVALDIEDPDAHGNLSPWALRWCAAVEAVAGVKPFIYSYPSYFGERSLTAPELAKYPLWLASYTIPYRDNWTPVAPKPWADWTIWQWSGGSKLRGIVFDTDENIFRGSREQLLAYTKPAQQTALPFQHAPGFIGPPLVDNFNWGGDTAGIIVKRETTVYNDELKKFFILRWTPDKGIEIGDL